MDQIILTLSIFNYIIMTTYKNVDDQLHQVKVQFILLLFIIIFCHNLKIFTQIKLCTYVLHRLHIVALHRCINNTSVSNYRLLKMYYHLWAVNLIY